MASLTSPAVIKGTKTFSLMFWQAVIKKELNKNVLDIALVLYHRKYKVLEYYSKGNVMPDDTFREIVHRGGAIIKANLVLGFIGQ